MPCCEEEEEDNDDDDDDEYQKYCVGYDNLTALKITISFVQ